MKSRTQDLTEGKLYEVKGQIKEEPGWVTGDPGLQVSGNAKKKAVKVREWVDRCEKTLLE